MAPWWLTMSTYSFVLRLSCRREKPHSIAIALPPKEILKAHLFFVLEGLIYIKMRACLIEFGH